MPNLLLASCLNRNPVNITRSSATVTGGAATRRSSPHSSSKAHLQACAHTAMQATGTQLAGVGEPLPAFNEPSKNDGPRCIYLDYNATTPIWPQVAEAMLPYLTHFGNPSSTHAFGRPCKAAVDRARVQVAALVGAEPDEVVFVSCGTEADNWAVWGAVTAARQQRQQRQQAAAANGNGSSSGGSSFTPHVVTSAIEHPAILECLSALESQGQLAYTLVPVDGEGRVSVEAVEAACTPDTVLISLMHSNNEVGSLQPVAEVAAMAARRGGGSILVHTDAAQSLGKVAVDVKALGVDMATIVGHKFGAPKGVAALYVRRGLALPQLLRGGGQEGGRRAGTENVLLAVGLGAAAELAAAELPAASTHMAAMRDRLQAALLAGLSAGTAVVNGPKDDSQRLPNTLSIGIRGVAASQLLAELSEQLAASAGAACHSHCGGGGKPSISAVLAAMGVPEEYAVGTLRLSTGRHTTAEEVDEAARLILGRVQQQQQAQQ